MDSDIPMEESSEIGIANIKETNKTYRNVTLIDMPRCTYTRITAEQKTGSLQRKTSISDLPVEIFEMIMKYLDFETYKSCRLVSKSWKNIATQFIASISEINVTRFFMTFKDGSQALSDNFSEDIVKFIKRQSPNDEEHFDPSKEFELLLRFCTVYGNLVEGIICDGYDHKECDRSYSLPIIFKLLIKLCPNMNELRLTNNDDITCNCPPSVGPKVDEMDINRLEFGDQTLGLKHLQIEALDYFQSVSIKEFIKKIISASTNLNVLNIHTAGYCKSNLDLSNNKKLVELYIGPSSAEDFSLIDFPYDNQIESLTIDIQEVGQIIKKILPTFKCLRSLSIDISIQVDEDDFIDTEYVEGNWPINFGFYMLKKSPNLVNLEITKAQDGERNYEDEFRDIFRSGNPHYNLSKLILQDFEDENTFKAVVNNVNFPNLKTLKFKIGEYDSLSAQELKLKLRTWFKILSDLNLSHLNVSFECELGMSTLANIVSCNPLLFQGLETLALDHTSKIVADDIFKSPNNQIKFKYFLKMTSSLTLALFSNFYMTPCMMDELKGFINKHSLPVKFVYN